MTTSHIADAVDPIEPATPKPTPAPSLDDRTAADLVVAELAARRRRWPFLFIGLLVGAGVALAVTTYLDRADDGDGAATTEQVALSTAPVEARDLLEEVEWSGTLQYGEPLTITGSGGTITAATPAGATVTRGDVIAWIDEEPVVALYGQRPLWRTLRDGVEGVDVLLLETNLVALGYDPDTTVTVDEEFTANTEAMVERWQEDIGREVTGTVGVADVVLLPGPAVITSEATVGATAQGAVATASSQRTTGDVVSALSGQVAELVAVGAVVDHGVTLFVIDEVPVVAVTAAAIADDPVLEVITGASFTELELEQTLAAEGHDPDDDMTVDGVLTDATAAAVERWQDRAGLPVTGLAAPGYYRTVTAGQTVDAHLVTDGDAVTPRPILITSSSELEVVVEVAVADADEFFEGQSVTVELADESVVDGLVADIGTVTRAGAQADPTVTVVIEVVADADQQLVEGGVTVTTVSESILQATAVPTRALVSLAEGGFAVEVVGDGDTTQLVGVELGAFDEGYVEVTAGDVSVGDQVVVPQ